MLINRSAKSATTQPAVTTPDADFRALCAHLHVLGQMRRGAILGRNGTAAERLDEVAAIDSRIADVRARIDTLLDAVTDPAAA